MQEEADPQVRPQLAQQPRDQLQVVVLDPDACALRGVLGGHMGKPLVDVHIRMPPAAMILRLPDSVVIEWPDRAVAEPVVEGLQLAPRDRHGYLLDFVERERLGR